MRVGVMAVLASVMGIILAAAPAGAAEKFQVDPVHSSIIFRIGHMNVGVVYGRFSEFSGTFVLDEDPARSSFNVEVQAKSVDSANGKRDGHLRSADFFDVAQFPTITFKSTSVKKAAKGYEVQGDLTLHGVTKPITLNIEQIGKGDTKAGYRVGIETIVELKRSDFGMNTMQGDVGDDVRLIIAMEAKREK